MLFRFHPQQVGAQERAGNEIEGANGLLAHAPASRFFSLFFGNCSEIELVQFQLSGRMNDLHRRSVFGSKRRAQRFKPCFIAIAARTILWSALPLPAGRAWKWKG